MKGGVICARLSYVTSGSRPGRISHCACFCQRMLNKANGSRRHTLAQHRLLERANLYRDPTVLSTRQ